MDLKKQAQSAKVLHVRTMILCQQLEMVLLMLQKGLLKPDVSDPLLKDIIDDKLCTMHECLHEMEDSVSYLFQLLTGE